LRPSKILRTVYTIVIADDDPDLTEVIARGLAEATRAS
jgi:hypothetical protein